jgi:histidinol phosphatase-like enzyme
MDSPFAPLPGSGPPPRGLFVDRWGTLLERPGKGWSTRFDSTSFTPGAVDALFHAGQAGWNIYLIGNVEEVAFGHVSQARWDAFEAELVSALRAAGVHVTRSYSCSDHPDGVAGHTKDSVFLLPNTGAMYHAAQVDGIRLRETWVIGDSSLELVAGWRAGCRLAGVRTGEGLRDGQLHVEPDVLADDLARAVREATSGARVARH